MNKFDLKDRTAIITGGGYDHTFVPGAENSGCIVTGNSWYSGPFITPNSATYNPNTGILVNEATIPGR